MKPTLPSLLALTALTALTVTAHAAPAKAAAETEGNWLVRGRIITVDPANDGGHVNTLGGKPKVGTDTVPEIDITYFVTPNIGIEAIAATTEHKVHVTKRPAELDLGKVKLLPPTVTANYHFNLGNFKPYVGAGLTYAHFYDAEHPGYGSVKYDDNWGTALQVGADYQVCKNWVVNADIKKIFVSSDVTVNDTIKAKANLNPTVAGIGIGYRF